MDQGKDRVAVDRNQKDLLGLIDELKHERISRQQFVYRALGLGLSATAVGAFVGACGKSSSGGDKTAQANSIGPTTKPSQLYLYNWSDYMAPGVKGDFQKKTGIKVVEAYFDDNEALLAKLKAGATGYDVIVPSDYMIHIMIMSGLLEPLVEQYIPNMKFVLPQFQKPTYDNPASPENKNMKFSIPYQWGTTGLGVRTDKVDVASVTKWAAIFPPEGQALKGNIQMLNDEREDLGASLIFSGIRDQGKPFSVNTTDQTQLDTATQTLIDQKPLVRAYDSINMKRAMIQGTAVTMCWNGDALMAIDGLGGDAKAKALVKFVLPQEGFAYWVDNMAIPNGFRSKYAAHLFMDYILDPVVMANISSWTWYLPVEDQATQEPNFDQFVMTTWPSAADLARGEVFNDLGQFGRNYTDAWNKVKSA